jgi:hypothetical protein
MEVIYLTGRTNKCQSGPVLPLAQVSYFDGPIYFIYKS